MIRRAIALLTLAITLSGCTYFGSYFEVQELNKAQPKGSPFAQALTQQYKDRANYSQNIVYNYDQAYDNAERGLTAADGAPPAPYVLQNFNIPVEQQQEIAKARADLMNALNAGTRDRAPKEAAEAQAKLDCWIEDAEKTWLPELYKVCRQDFYNAFQQMIAMQGEPVDLSGTDLNAQTTPPAPDANRFMIFFGSSGAKLSPSVAPTLDQIAKIILQRQPKSVRVNGYSDATGSKKSRHRISQRRAIVVAEALIARGVPQKIIQTRGLGSADPLVKAKSKNVPANRRAEIWLDQ